MKLNLDGGKLLYALGVVFAVAALMFFVRDVVFGLSITVTAVLLFCIFVGSLIVGLIINRDLLDVVGYAIAGVTYVIFLWYVTNRYELGETGLFVVLLLSACLFVSLGYGVREQSIQIDRQKAIYAVIGLGAIGVIFVGADLTTGDIEYTVELEDDASVVITEEQAERDRPRVSTTVGTMTVRNPTPFSRPVDTPSARGCFSGGSEPIDEEFRIRYEPRSFGIADRLAGGEERTQTLIAEVPVFADEPREAEYAVEQADSCEMSHDEPTLVVVFDNDNPVVG